MDTLRKILVQYYSALMPVVATFVAIFVFVSGIGRYRVIIALAVYFAIKAYLKANKVESHVFEFIYVPIILFIGSVDINKGQLYQGFSYSNPVLAFGVCVILYFIIQNKVKYSAEVITNRQIFSLCPKCKYETTSLCVTCVNCGYSKNLYKEEQKNNCQHAQPSQDQLLYELSSNESILLTINTAFYTARIVKKNNMQILSTKIIFTDKKIVIFKGATFGRGGWVSREYINYDDIVSVEIAYKYHINRNVSVLQVVTCSNDAYDFYFITILKSCKHYSDMISAINSNR